MTFWHENACRVTWVLWWESTSHQWIHSQRTSNVCFDVFVDVILNKRFSKYSIYRWFETTWCSLRRHYNHITTKIARFMGPTWGPPGSCRPQMGPMLAPWTLSSGYYQAPIYQNNSPSPTNAYMHQGAVSIRKTVLPGMAIPMLKIRRPNGRLIFNMEITIRR